MASKLVFWLSLGFLLDLHSTHGAISRGIGECPNGAKPGESWYVEGRCEQCECSKGSYSCYSCGVYSIPFDPDNCYTYKEEEKMYPGCCAPIVKCRGDEGFNERMLAGKIKQL